MTLAEYIAANLRKPFAYGDLDCVLFASAWVKHKTGVDHLAGVPTWSSEKAALRLLRRMGGLEKLLDARLTRTHPNLAQDGDIALHKGGLFLFSGPHIVGPGARRLEFFGRTKAECAWRAA